DAPGPVSRPVHENLLRATRRHPAQRGRPALGVVLMAQPAAIGESSQAQATLAVVAERLAMATTEQAVLEHQQASGGVVLGPARLRRMVDRQRMPALPADPARDAFVAPQSQDFARPARVV